MIILEERSSGPPGQLVAPRRVSAAGLLGPLPKRTVAGGQLKILASGIGGIPNARLIAEVSRPMTSSRSARNEKHVLPPQAAGMFLKFYVNVKLTDLLPFRRYLVVLLFRSVQETAY